MPFTDHGENTRDRAVISLDGHHNLIGKSIGTVEASITTTIDKKGIVSINIYL